MPEMSFAHARWPICTASPGAVKKHLKVDASRCFM
jgi:hypothetical protein